MERAVKLCIVIIFILALIIGFMLRNWGIPMEGISFPLKDADGEIFFLPSDGSISMSLDMWFEFQEKIREEYREDRIKDFVEELKVNGFCFTEFDKPITIEGADHVTILNCTFHGSPGINVPNAKSISFKDCYFGEEEVTPISELKPSN